MTRPKSRQVRDGIRSTGDVTGSAFPQPTRTRDADGGRIPRRMTGSREATKVDRRNVFRHAAGSSRGFEASRKCRSYLKR